MAHPSQREEINPKAAQLCKNNGCAKFQFMFFSLQQPLNKLRSGTNSHFSSFLRLLRANVINLLLLTSPLHKSAPFIF